MSSEYFKRNSLYLVRLKIFSWLKLFGGHLHQILGKWAGRNLITASRVNSRLVTHARIQRWIWHLQLPTDSYFWIINSLMASWGLQLTRLDCNCNKDLFFKCQSWWRLVKTLAMLFSNFFPYISYKYLRLKLIYKAQLQKTFYGYLKGLCQEDIAVLCQFCA